MANGTLCFHPNSSFVSSYTWIALVLFLWRYLSHFLCAASSRLHPHHPLRRVCAVIARTLHPALLARSPAAHAPSPSFTAKTLPRRCLRRRRRPRACISVDDAAPTPRSRASTLTTPPSFDHPARALPHPPSRRGQRRLTRAHSNDTAVARAHVDDGALTPSPDLTSTTRHPCLCCPRRLARVPFAAKTLPRCPRPCPRRRWRPAALAPSTAPMSTSSIKAFIIGKYQV
ncbi:hypothetical protein B0H13DRAFT_2343791 [Mycena leptocephala]|nr:hypothetical protein B0H13DRAFT_2343791 [Mycena leptocephala]